MQVFRLYFKLLKSVSPALIIYAIVFTVLIIMISSNKEVNTINYEDTKIKTALVNYNEDDVLVKDFVDYLGQFCEFYYYGDDEADIADALFFRKVEYIITIPYQFGNDFMEGMDVIIEKKTVPDSVYATTVDNAINVYLNTARIYINQIPNITENELISYVRNDIDKESIVNIEASTITKDEGNKFYNNYFNTASYIMLSCSLLGVGLIMLSFHNIHIRRRIMATPLTMKDMNLQLISGNMIFIAFYDIFFILLGFLLSKDNHITSNLLLYWLNLFVFSISALSISYLAAMLVKKKEVNGALSYVLPLGLSFISGAFVPQMFLGDFVLRIASFTPVYWFIKGNNIIGDLTSFDWVNTKAIYFYMLIQLGFAAALFSMVLVISKNKMQGDYS